jgi:methionine sulfoxide reductase heme-binding subunit
MTVRLPANSYLAIRIRRHAILALSATVLNLGLYVATPPPDIRHRLSLATAYASLTFLVVCLSLGPWNVVRRRFNPVSFDLRRDIGIWSGALAVVHTAIGLTVHLRGRMWMYFLKRLHPPKLQNTQFGAANYSGLIAALLFVLLLAISNDFSLRLLRTRKWKSLQRWTYLAVMLTVLHGFLYQLIEKRHKPWLVIYWTLILLATGMQVLGFLKTSYQASTKSSSISE